jgi:SAM-dependent methyltransferase
MPTGKVRTEEEKLELLKSLGGMTLQEKWDLMLDISAQEDVPSIGQLPQILHLVGKIPSGVKKVLVVGCGDGTEIDELQKAGYEAVGIQVNTAENDKIRAKGLDARDMDMHFMTFETGEFDMIMCKDCFKQAMSPTICFAEFCRVAKKYILISEPDMKWAWKARNYQLFTPEQFKIMGDKFGYPLDNFWILEMGYVSQHNYLFKKAQ